MNHTSAANASRGNDLSSSNTPPSMAEGIALCVAFTSTFVLTVAGNLPTIIIFAKNKNIYKNHFSLVVNTAFDDLLLGNVSLPMFTYHVGFKSWLWTSWIGKVNTNKPIYSSLHDLWTFFPQVSLIYAAFISCERFHAIYWPVKHPTRIYRIVAFTVWILALLISVTWTASNLLLSYKHTMFIWGPYTLILELITFGCNLGIGRKF